MDDQQKTKRNYILTGILILIWVFSFGYMTIKDRLASRTSENSTATTTVSDKTIKIGVALALSGDAAPWGEASRNAVELAAADLSKSNILGGKKLQFFIEDTKSSSKDSVSAVSKLLNIDAADAIMVTWLDSYQGAESIVPPTKVLISEDAAIEAVNEPLNHTNVFSLWYRTKSKSETILGDMQKSGYKKVYIVTLNDSYYTKLQQFFGQEAASRNMKILGTESLLADADTKTVISKIIQAKPDAVFFGSYDDKLSVNFFKNFAELTKGKIPLYGDEFVDQDFKGTSFNKQWFENIRFFVPADPDANFAAEYRQKFGKEPEFSAVNTYDTFTLLAKTIANSGTDDIAAILKKGEFDTFTYGKIRFDDIGGVVSDNKAIVMKQIKNGQISVVK